MIRYFKLYNNCTKTISNIWSRTPDVITTYRNFNLKTNCLVALSPNPETLKYTTMTRTYVCGVVVSATVCDADPWFGTRQDETSDRYLVFTCNIFQNSMKYFEYLPIF